MASKYHKSLLHHTILNLRIMINLMLLLLKILWLGIKNIWHEGLRVTVNQREPCALDLDLHLMSLFKSMENIL